MKTLPRQLLFGVCVIASAVAFANVVHGETAPVVVGLAKCSDCTRKNMNAEAAFKGLLVAVKCKNSKGEYESKAVGQVDKTGAFSVPLAADLVGEDGELKQDCLAQLHSASSAPCPGQEPSKIVAAQPGRDGKKTFVALAGKMHQPSAECASAFLCDPIHKHLHHLIFHKPIDHDHSLPPPVDHDHPPPVDHDHPPPVDHDHPPPVDHDHPPPVDHDHPLPPPVDHDHPPPVDHDHPLPPPVDHDHSLPPPVDHDHSVPPPVTVPEHKPPSTPVYTPTPTKPKPTPTPTPPKPKPTPTPTPVYTPTPTKPTPTPTPPKPTPIYHPPAQRDAVTDPQLFKKLLPFLKKLPFFPPGEQKSKP